MSNLKFYTLIMLISFFICPNHQTFAQEEGASILKDFSRKKPSPEEVASKTTEKMTKELNLSQEQSNQIKVINLKYAQQIFDLKEDESKDRHEKHMTIRQIREAKRAEVGKVLTEEQKTILKEKHTQRKRQERAFMKEVKDNESLKNALKAYHKQNIKPVMFAKREVFENELSENEKTIIAKARKDLEAFKPEMKALKEKFRSKKENRIPPSETERTEIKTVMSKRKAISEILKPIIEKHQYSLKVIFEGLKSEREKWKNDTENIIKNNTNIEEMPEEVMHRFSRKFRGKHKKHFGVERFLLMNPNENYPQKLEINAFPNPASQSSRISFEIQEAGQVKIDLLDDKGNLVKNILNEYKETGKYKINVSTQGLEGKLYYYTINTKQGKSTKRLIIQK